MSQIWYNKSDTNSPTSKDSSPKFKKSNSIAQSPTKSHKVSLNMKGQKNILGSLVTDSSRFLTEKLSRIETKVYDTENSAVKIPKLEEITTPPNEMFESVNGTPSHSKSPSRLKMESLVRLLGAKKDTEEGWNRLKLQQNSMSESGINLYDQLNGFLTKDNKK